MSYLCGNDVCTVLSIIKETFKDSSFSFATCNMIVAVSIYSVIKRITFSMDNQCIIKKEIDDEFEQSEWMRWPYNELY